jgi:ribosomal-protein-serine acetyltransferase
VNAAAIAPTRALSGLRIPARSALRISPVTTERTLLTPIDPADGPELWQVVNASRSHLEHWLPWVPFNNNADASQRFAEASAADWDFGRAVRLGVRDKKTKALLGVVSLEACVALQRSCTLGYWLRRESCGKGLMTEAAAASVKFAFESMGVHRIACAAITDNHTSLRVIGRLKFKFEGIARHAELVGSRWVDHAIFARLATDDD